MLTTFKDVLAHQFEAALSTVKACIDRCPDAAWNLPVGNHSFCRVAFHTLFFTDYYLGRDEDSIRQQQFHRDHALAFRDYEELEDREPQWLYERAFVEAYLDHCRAKALEVMKTETTETLTAGAGFGNRPYSRAELHVRSIRHIQHHAAQMSLRLRIDHGVDVPWMSSGWCEV